MTPKEIYCMGRAEYLAEYEAYSLAEALIKRNRNKVNYL